MLDVLETLLELKVLGEVGEAHPGFSMHQYLPGGYGLEDVPTG